ncbi:MAG: hypothetical protein ACO3RV_03710, partial [Luteolibacter sp.]
YDSARYDEAIQHWLSAGEYSNLTADLLYNIGNACYRAGANGHAALYYRRALVKDASHAEARQNLRFLERKLGSISVDRPQFQYALAKLPLSFWQGAFWAGLWALVLAILAFPASRPNDRSRLVALVVLVISPIWLAASGLGWRYFPDDANFAPLARQAVVVANDVVLYNAASRTSPEVIDAPPGSLCEIIRKSGRWAYVAFATRTRGWVPVDALELLIPQSPPVVPTMRKPRANADNA